MMEVYNKAAQNRMQLIVLVIYTAFASVGSIFSQIQGPLHFAKKTEGSYSLELVQDNNSSQTLAHFKQSAYRESIFDGYYLQPNIARLGSDVVEGLINNIVTNEIQYKKTHPDSLVFYHGQMLEFTLMQDLIAGLSQLLYKKSIKNFIYMRTPDSSFEKYQNAHQFLSDCNYNVSDSTDPAKTLLLSVNPWLFGNIRNYGSCTLGYFLASDNCSNVDFDAINKQIFTVFKIERFFDKYQKTLTELGNLLTQKEPGRTGLLLQIFIPNKLANTIVYRSHPGGTPYYSGSKISPLVSPPQLPADELQKFCLEKTIQGQSLDDLQYRILFTKDMLNPESDIEIVRYYNHATDAMKKYEAGIKEFFTQLAKDLTKDGLITR